MFEEASRKSLEAMNALILKEKESKVKI